MHADRPASESRSAAQVKPYVYVDARDVDVSV